jgi:hypothetical protein
MQIAQTQRIEQDLKQYSFLLYQGALVAFQRDTRLVQSPELLGQAKIKVMLETSYITSIKVNRRGIAESYERKDDHQE